MADTSFEVRAQAMANAIIASLGKNAGQVDNAQFWALVTEAAKDMKNGMDPVLVGQGMTSGLRMMFNVPAPTADASQMQSGSAPAAGGGGSGKTANAVPYADVAKYLNFDNAGLVQVGVEGSPYILGKDKNTGKVITAYELDPDTGLYVPIDVGGAGTGGAAGGGSSGSGGGAAAGPSYIDIQNADLANRTLERNIFESDREFAERTRQYNQNFGENSRQFDTSEKRMNMSDVGQLGVQLGNLNLEQQKHIAQILREPADFLARAFTQRGGTSPFPEITQADLINKLKSEFDRIRNFTGNEMQTRVGPAAAAMGAPKPGAMPAGGAPRMDMGGGGAAPQPDSAGFGALGTRYDLQPGYQGLTQAQEVAFHQEGLAQAGVDRAASGDTNVQPWEQVAQDYQNRGYNVPGFAEGTDGGPKKGPVKNRISLVGEEGPELLFNHGDGTFDVLDAKKTRILMGDKGAMQSKIDGFKSGTVANPKRTSPGAPRRKYDDERVDLTGVEDRRPQGIRPAKAVKNGSARSTTSAERAKEATKGVDPYKRVTGYAEGTLDGLTPDVMGRMSLFDVAQVPGTSQQQLLDYAQKATPPGPASVASGVLPPTLDVTKGSSFKLFSPQQYMSLTPDEQAALSTRLASENRSLGDFLFSSQKNFAGKPRQQRRARMDVME